MADITWDASQPTWDSSQVTWDGWQALGTQLRLSVTHQNHDMGDIITAAGATPYLLIYTGARPANCAASATGTLLVSLPCSNPLGTVFAGVLKFNPITPTSVVANGTAGYFRLCTSSAGATVIAQGSVDVTGSDLNFSSGTAFTIGVVVVIPVFTIATNDANFDTGISLATITENSDAATGTGVATPLIAVGSISITETNDAPVATGTALNVGSSTAAIVEGHDAPLGSGGVAAPSAPFLSTMYKGDTTATMQWTAPSSSGGAPITLYNIYAGATLVATQAPTDYGFITKTVTGLVNGTPVIFSVGAVNTGGEGPRSSYAAVTPGTPCYPDPPANLVATLGPGANQITLNWDVPVHTGGSAISSYSVGYFSPSLGFHSPGLGGVTNSLVYDASTQVGLPLEFFVNAANAGFGISSYSQASNTVISGARPTQVQLLLQGQTAQGRGSNVGGINGIQPQSPNYTMIGWLSVASATQYNIYRATIPVGSQATGTLNYGASPYATITASAAATAYSGYVSGSGAYSHQTAVNCAYGDVAATLCQNPTRGGGTGTTGPTVSPGDLWAATGYSYKVSAIVGGVESPLSDPHFGVFISNGLRILNDSASGAFNNMPVTNATDGGVTPTGNTLTTRWNGVTSPYWNPYVNDGTTEWMLNLRQWNYFQFYIKAGQAGDPGLSTAFEQEGDLTLDVGIAGGQAKGPVFSKYGTLVSGQYVLIKMSLADLATDIVRGRQNTFYKFGSFGGTNGSTGTWWLDDMKFTT